MQPISPESKPRLFLLLGMPVLLFGGFALWGIADRARQNTFVDPIESPAKLSAERVEVLTKQREAFALRKQMAVFGKTEKWQKAARLVTDEFLARNDFRNLRFLRGEAWYRAGDGRGGIALRDALKGDGSLNEHEADLLAGTVAPYSDAATVALRDADRAKISPLDANNLAWRVALVPNISDTSGIEKTVQLSEDAVREARAKQDGEMLATYTNTLGAVYVRARRDKDAVRVLTESEQLRSDPFNAAFLCLAYRDIGDTKTAALWRNRLQAYLNNTYATRDGQMYRHQLLLLWRETQESGDVKDN